MVKKYDYSELEESFSAMEDSFNELAFRLLNTHHSFVPPEKYQPLLKAKISVLARGWLQTLDGFVRDHAAAVAPHCHRELGAMADRFTVYTHMGLDKFMYEDILNAARAVRVLYEKLIGPLGEDKSQSK